jgi:hypothetical protein
MTTSSLDWIWWLSGASLAALAGVLLAWSLFWDRSRGRRRCPKCWYDMAGVPGLVCPECGRPARRERALRKTRRHPWWAGLAMVLLLLGVGAANTPRVARSGWVGLVPSTALAWFAPIGSTGFALQLAPQRIGGGPARQPGTELLHDELWKRFDSGSMAAWQERVVLRRYLKAFSAMQSIAVQAPERWPVGEPLPVIVSNALYSRVRLRVRCREPGSAWMDARESHGLLGAVPDECRSLQFEVKAETDQSSVTAAAMNVPVHIAGGVGTFLDRVDSAEARDQVAALLRPRFVDMGRWGAHLTFSNRAWSLVKPAFAVMFRFEIVLDGRTLAVGSGGADDPWTFKKVEWIEDGEAAAIAAAGRAEIIVRGDPDAAGRMYIERPFDGRPAACWVGEFRVPLIITGERPW